MDAYLIGLYLHILGAFGVFIALAFEWLGMTRLRASTSRAEAMTWLGVLAPLRFLAPVALILLLVSGLYMAGGRWGFTTWPAAAIAGLAALLVLGAVLTGGTMQRLGPAIGREPGPGLSPGTLALLARPTPIVSLWLRSGLALGIVALMVFKPDLVASIVVLLATALLGFVIGTARVRTERSAAAAPR